MGDDVCGGSKSAWSRSVAMVAPFSGRPRPSRPSRRSPDGGRTGPAPRSVSDDGRSTAEDGGRRLFCFAMQSRETSTHANRRGVKSRRWKIAAVSRCGPDRLPSDRLWRRGGAVLPGRQDHREQRCDRQVRERARSHRPDREPSVELRNRGTSSGVSWRRKAARR
jgi:hypothetical protein